MRRLALAVGLGFVSLLALTPAAGAAVPNGFHESIALGGLEFPMAFDFAADGRVFVAEKAGRVLVFDDVDDSQPTVFADLRDEVFSFRDRGLLGLAVDPEFPQRPYVYVLYARDARLYGDLAPWGDTCPDPPGADSGGCAIRGRLSRLVATTEGGETITEDEEVLLEDWCQQFSSHSIGDLKFGADGALYASGGEGANFGAPDYGQFGNPGFGGPNPCGDPPSGVGGMQTPPSAEGGALRSQDVLTLADPTGLNGSIVRIDPDSAAGLPGNPLFGSADPNARRIVAHGFRNPFRFAVDSATNEVYVGNVGWNDFEEIDRFDPVAAAPYNSGWPCYEGNGPQDVYEEVGLALCEGLYDTPGSTSPPFFLYGRDHGLFPSDECPTADGAALSALAVYDGDSFPAAYDGALFFADSVRRCIWVMLAGQDGRPDPEAVTTFVDAPGQIYPGLDMKVGPEGDLYYLSMFDDEEDAGEGTLRRIEHFSTNKPPVARLSVDRQWSEGDLEAEFDASASSDADGDELAFRWDLKGDGEFSDASPDAVKTALYDDAENHTVTVRAIDPDGASSVDRITVYPNDTPPQPEIVSPDPGFEWAVGDAIEFEGEADDEEDGAVPAADLDWSARLFHCPSACHAHPIQTFPAVAEGSFPAPEHEYPAHIELTLTAVDSRGLAASETVRIDPRTVDVTITANRPGLELGAGPLVERAPFVLRVIRGSNVVLAAPATQELAGELHTWQGWSDGGSRVHAVAADEAASYEALYSWPADGKGGQLPGLGASLDPFARRRLRVRLTAHPPKRTARSWARFRFSANLARAHFRCRLDGGLSRSCRSPKTYRRLAPGRHTFAVRAVDGPGRVSPRAVFRWRVLAATARGGR